MKAPEGHFAKSDAESCTSHFRPSELKGAATRCTRMAGHAGWHQDERFNWPEKAAVQGGAEL